MINQVIVQYDGLDEYLKVADAYVDVILQNHMVRLTRFSYLLDESKVPVGCNTILADWFFEYFKLIYFLLLLLWGGYETEKYDIT